MKCPNCGQNSLVIEKTTSPFWNPFTRKYHYVCLNCGYKPKNPLLHRSTKKDIVYSMISSLTLTLLFQAIIPIPGIGGSVFFSTLYLSYMWGKTKNKVAVALLSSAPLAAFLITRSLPLSAITFLSITIIAFIARKQGVE